MRVLVAKPCEKCKGDGRDHKQTGEGPILACDYCGGAGEIIARIELVELRNALNELPGTLRRY